MNSDDLERTIAYWEAANYLTAAQIYLRDNPLLREPLGPEHVKPRLLGHWGTSPGLNLIYAPQRPDPSHGCAGALDNGAGPQRPSDHRQRQPWQV